MSGVVYKITCRGCGDEYVGETARPLHVRVKEHIDGMRRMKESTALGSHRIRKHNRGVFEVIVKVVAQESEFCARKLSIHFECSSLIHKRIVLENVSQSRAVALYNIGLLTVTLNEDLLQLRLVGWCYHLLGGFEQPTKLR
uniref:C2H2-type domain-containing protein n=1 Tax=Haemonchus contortus TaxID=6289 RepID=A0A7I4YWR5_HAECO